MTPIVLPPTDDVRRPLRVMFLHTSVDIGGAETVTLNLIRRFDRSRFEPELCCLKARGTIGELLSAEVPVFDHLLRNKYDLRVLPRLTRLLRRRRIDAIVSVGAGDKMFWGRSAAWLAGVPVIISAIHSTGYPDRIGRLNRMLTPLTNMFIGVAETHGRYLVEQERFPAEKVCVIPNGVDTERFRPRAADPELRRRLGLRSGPVAGTVARLGPEKNHELFLDVAARTRQEVPDAQFLLIGDGPLADVLRRRARRLGIADCVHFLGWRSDVPELLSLLDAFLLTSHIEANPVSILEALATGLPVVSTRVGSVAETVRSDNGFLVEPGDAAGMARHLARLFRNPVLARRMGAAGRQLVIRRWSLDQMVQQYEDVIESIYRTNRLFRTSRRLARQERPVAARERPKERAVCP
jgi:glycosyltransferase involved in cell wall biosynthesis